SSVPLLADVPYFTYTTLFRSYRVGIAHGQGGNLQRAPANLQGIGEGLGVRREGNVPGRETGRAHVHPDLAVGQHQQGDDPGAGAHLQLVLAGQAAIPHELGETAGAVAALGHLAAVAVVDAVVEIHVGGGGRLHHQYLIAADAEVAVGEAAGEVRCHRQFLGDGVDDHEVIAEAVHLGEAQQHCGLLRQQLFAAHHVVDGFAAADEVVGVAVDHHFGGPAPGVVVGTHGKAV